MTTKIYTNEEYINRIMTKHNLEFVKFSFSSGDEKMRVWFRETNTQKLKSALRPYQDIFNEIKKVLNSDSLISHRLRGKNLTSIAVIRGEQTIIRNYEKAIIE